MPWGPAMIVVIGHLTIAAGQRDRFIELSTPAVVQARGQAECMHFAVAPDPVDPDRVDVGEVWSSRDALEAFRDGGPSAQMDDLIVAAEVAEHVVAELL